MPLPTGIGLNTSADSIQAVRSIMTMVGKYIFYIKGDHWEVGASLLNQLRVGLGDSVNIELDIDKPYVQYAEQMRKYPPG